MAKDTSVLDFLKAASVFVIGLLVIAVNVFIWNTAATTGAPKTIVWASVINFVLEGVGLYFYAKAIDAFGKRREKEEQEAKKAEAAKKTKSAKKSE